MKILICPGIHPTDLSDRFVAQLQATGKSLPEFVIFPAERLPVYSPRHVLGFLSPDMLVIAFSAGVVGAIGAIRLRPDKPIRALIAIDGWGVPLAGNFPIHRISHDAFTHWSSALLGAGQESFYADPPVAHLSLWESPQLAINKTTSQSAAEFMTTLIQQYYEKAIVPSVNKS
jgi:hypothetical protein